jgi:hypothetical protein
MQSLVSQAVDQVDALPNVQGTIEQGKALAKLILTIAHAYVDRMESRSSLAAVQGTYGKGDKSKAETNRPENPSVLKKARRMASDAMEDEESKSSGTDKSKSLALRPAPGFPFRWWQSELVQMASTGTSFPDVFGWLTPTDVWHLITVSRRFMERLEPKEGPVESEMKSLVSFTRVLRPHLHKALRILADLILDEVADEPLQLTAPNGTTVPAMGFRGHAYYSDILSESVCMWMVRSPLSLDRIRPAPFPLPAETTVDAPPGFPSRLQPDDIVLVKDQAPVYFVLTSPCSARAALDRFLPLVLSKTINVVGVERDPRRGVNIYKRMASPVYVGLAQLRNTFASFERLDRRLGTRCVPSSLFRSSFAYARRGLEDHARMEEGEENGTINTWIWLRRVYASHADGIRVQLTAIHNASLRNHTWETEMVPWITQRVHTLFARDAGTVDNPEVVREDRTHQALAFVQGTLDGSMEWVHSLGVLGNDMEQSIVHMIVALWSIGLFTNMTPTPTQDMFEMLIAFCALLVPGALRDNGDQGSRWCENLWELLCTLKHPLPGQVLVHWALRPEGAHVADLADADPLSPRLPLKQLLHDMQHPEREWNLWCNPVGWEFLHYPKATGIFSMFGHVEGAFEALTQFRPKGQFPSSYWWSEGRASVSAGPNKGNILVMSKNIHILNLLVRLGWSYDRILKWDGYGDLLDLLAPAVVAVGLAKAYQDFAQDPESIAFLSAPLTLRKLALARLVPEQYALYRQALATSLYDPRIPFQHVLPLLFETVRLDVQQGVCSPAQVAQVLRNEYEALFHNPCNQDEPSGHWLRAWAQRKSVFSFFVFFPYLLQSVALRPQDTLTRENLVRIVSHTWKNADGPWDASKDAFQNDFDWHRQVHPLVYAWTRAMVHLTYQFGYVLRHHRQHVLPPCFAALDSVCKRLEWGADVTQPTEATLVTLPNDPLWEYVPLLWHLSVPYWKVLEVLATHLWRMDLHVWSQGLVGLLAWRVGHNPDHASATVRKAMDQWKAWSLGLFLYKPWGNNSTGIRPSTSLSDTLSRGKKPGDDRETQGPVDLPDHPMDWSRDDHKVLPWLSPLLEPLGSMEDPTARKPWEPLWVESIETKKDTQAFLEKRLMTHGVSFVERKQLHLYPSTDVPVALWQDLRDGRFSNGSESTKIVFQSSLWVGGMSNEYSGPRPLS